MSCTWLVGMHVVVSIATSTDLIPKIISIPTTMHARRGTAGAVALHVVAPKPLAAAFPKVLGGVPAFGVIFHISENALPFASEPQPSVRGACDPGSIALAKPLPWL